MSLDLPGALIYDEPMLRAGAGLPIAEYESTNDGIKLLAGVFAERRPRPTLPRNYAGAILCSYADDYYNRFWLIPPLIELGSVSVNVQFNVKLWNAYLTPVTVSQWAYEGQLDGIDFVSNHEHPRLYPPLAVEGFTLYVMGEGAATINGRLRILSSAVEEPLLPITGQRAVLWDSPLWPNWDRSPVVIKYEYLTEVLVSRSGKEQRLRKRALPRKTVEFEARAIDSQGVMRHRQMRMTMLAQQNKTFVVPEWPRRMKLTRQTGSNDTVLFLEDIPPWLYADRQIIVSNGVAVDLATVESVDVAAKSITLKSFMSQMWRAGEAYVCPALTCYMPDKITGTMHLPIATTHQITFVQFPTTEKDEAFDEGSATIPFDGREVFPFLINWRTDLSLEEMWPVETVLYDSGPVERFRIVNFPTRVTKFSMLAKSQSEAEEMRRFFMRMKGRQKEFWFPSQEDDFALKEATPAGINTARVEGVQLLQVYELTQRSLRAVVFRQLDGTQIRMKIATVTLRNDSFGVDTLITFYENLPSSVGPGYTKFISWMSVARFAIDSLSFAYETPGVAQIEASVQTLPYAEAE